MTHSPRVIKLTNPAQQCGGRFPSARLVTGTIRPANRRPAPRPTLVMICDPSVSARGNHEKLRDRDVRRLPHREENACGDVLGL